MKLGDMIDLLEARFEHGDDAASMEITGVCASDLMSDVLAFAAPGSLLLTGLTNAQSVVTADVADVAVIAYVRGKTPAPDVIELARQRGIPVLVCGLSMFEACGRLHGSGLVPGSDIKGRR